MTYYYSGNLCLSLLLVKLLLKQVSKCMQILLFHCYVVNALGLSVQGEISGKATALADNIIECNVNIMAALFIKNLLQTIQQ